MNSDIKKLHVNPELLMKYDKPGPRYTSYPTAPVWRDDFTAEEYLQQVIKTNQGEDLAPLSLYFHIPFCNSLCLYCGCNVVITQRMDRVEEYLNYLKKEIEMVAKHISPKRKVVQYHWGGGSPNYLKPEQMEELWNFIAQRFQFDPNAEIGIEVDPRDATVDQIKLIRKLGFNRISFGVQDFDPVVQKAVNRIQPEDHIRKLITTAREAGFHSVNMDLIYGLPFQTVESFERTVDKTIEIGPDRMAVFNYAHVPWLKKQQRAIKEETLPKGMDKIAILKMIIEKFTGAGYQYIGMDHFAKPGNELAVAQREKTLYRNFQGYTTKAGTDLYAMGVTSISQVGNCYGQNVKELPEYYQMLKEDKLPIHRGYMLSQDDLLRRYVITRLMCDFELTKADVEKKFNVKFDTYFAEELKVLESMTGDGLLTLQPDKIIVHELGYLLIRNIAMAFDAYLKRPQEKPVFSRTI